MSQVSTDSLLATQGNGALLTDRFGRVHKSLRISVTDACNIRCQYCMPAEDVEFTPHGNLLTFEEIEWVVDIFAGLGVSQLRLTGGEPLLRKGLANLVRRLAQGHPASDLALTTNGILLADQVESLAAAGLKRINISLDTLEESVFNRIARRQGLARVLEGIEAARSIAGLEVKLNALVLRDVNLDGLLDLVEFAIGRDLPLRFIEFMPLDAERAWNAQRMVSGAELRERIRTKFGDLVKRPNQDPSRPAREYAFADGRSGKLGFIDSVSTPFCGHCDRLRLTADGKIRNCLFGQQEWDIRDLLQQEGTPEKRKERIVEQIKHCVASKFASHGISDDDFQPPERPMYQIGG